MKNAVSFLEVLDKTTGIGYSTKDVCESRRYEKENVGSMRE